MAGNRVQLIHEIDATPSIREAAKVEAAWNKSHKGLEKGAKTAASKVSRSNQAIAGASAAATASIAAQQQAWLSMGTTVASAFAAGGVIAGGIALTGSLIGALSKQTDKTEERWRRDFEGMEAKTKSLREQTLSMQREFQETRGVDHLREQLKALSKQADEAGREANTTRQRFEELDAAAKKSTPFSTGVDLLKRFATARQSGVVLPSLSERRGKAQGQLKRDEAEANVLKAQEAEIVRQLDIRTASRAQARFKVTTSINRALEDRIALLRADTTAAKRRVQQEQALRNLTEQVLGTGKDKLTVEGLRAKADAAGTKERAAALREAADQLERFPRLLDKMKQATRLASFGPLTKRAEATVTGLLRQNVLLTTDSPRARERRRLEFAKEDALKRIGTVPSGAPPELERSITQSRSLVEDQFDLAFATIGKRFPTAFESFQQSIGPQLTSGLAGAITAGATQGSDGVKSVLLNLAQSLTSQLLNLGIGTLLGGGGPDSSFGGIFGGALSFLFPQGKKGGATGASFITQGTGLFFAGERGPELVAGDRNTTDVTPLKQLQGGEPSIVNNVTVHVSGRADGDNIAGKVRDALLRLQRTSRGRRVLRGR